MRSLKDLFSGNVIAVYLLAFSHVSCHCYDLSTDKTKFLTDNTGCVTREKVYFIITKTRLYSFDPLKPHFYLVKLGFTGVYIISLIFAQKHRLWNLCFVQKYEKYQCFLYLKIFIIWR